MDKATLVSVDVEMGAQILQILDDAKLNVRVALWLYSPDYEDWRLVLSSPQFDEAGPVQAYGFVHDALEAAGISREKTPPIMILRMNSPFIRAKGEERLLTICSFVRRILGATPGFCSPSYTGTNQHDVGWGER